MQQKGKEEAIKIVGIKLVNKKERACKNAGSFLITLPESRRLGRSRV